ncbi:MAG: hypothetical protein J5858_01640, partial [Lentisphaeria bacterium]|nr:hypothetical protein [Lentisphaeria bacterium]
MANIAKNYILFVAFSNNRLAISQNEGITVIIFCDSFMHFFTMLHSKMGIPSNHCSSTSQVEAKSLSLFLLTMMAGLRNHNFIIPRPRQKSKREMPEMQRKIIDRLPRQLPARSLPDRG